MTPLTLDDFMRVLAHTDGPTVALAEITSSLLRLLLSDTDMLHKLSDRMPLNVHYSQVPVANPAAALDRRASTASLSTANTGHADTATTNTSTGASSVVEWEEAFIEQYDATYTGLRLLPYKLSPLLVTSLTWPVLLRCIILRLPHVFSFGTNTNNINGQQQWAEQKVKNVDEDLGITSDCYIDRFQALQSAAQEMGTSEFYELTVMQKLTILSALSEACYETERVRVLMSTHATERNVLLVNRAKAIREKTLEVSSSKCYWTVCLVKRVMCAITMELCV